VSPLRSVGARLSLALAVVVAVALGVVYAAVVPSLERNLVQARLEDLEQEGSEEANLLLRGALVGPDDPVAVADQVDEAASRADARVVILTLFTRRSLQVLVDSQGTRAEELTSDPVALEAARTLVSTKGTVTRDGERFAEVAFVISSFPSEQVLLFSASLEDTLANVQLIERRVGIAGVLALVVAALIGYGGASLFARRIRRLERAAERIAGGRFDEPVVDRSADELGQLADAFERMRRRLAQLDNARREFIANASHELRTPLFSLGGFLELMSSEELDEPTRREFLGTMREQVDRLTKLATELLDLSRLDAGRLHVEREPLDLAELAEVVTEEFAAVALAGGHHLEVVGQSERAALGDDGRVLQIGRILVENALRHTPRATPVTVRVGSYGDRVFLAVEDEGPGIRPEHAEQVFERFYRVEGARASGSGLGLAIARELAELMGGTLRLTTRSGRTILSLELPAAGTVLEGKAREPVPG